MPEEKTVNSIVRAVNILKVIVEGNNQLSGISKSLQLGKGTVHRILKTLEETGLVRQDPINRHYFLGPLVARFSASSPIAHHFLLYCSHEELKFLRDLSRETVNLQIRMGLQRVCIEEFESPEAIKYISGAGAVHPLYLGSAGKLLLAEMKDDEVHVILEQISLDAVCTNTIVDKTILLQEIDRIRKQGYALSFSERIKGSASISVPIRNYPCPVSLNVLGLENRFDKKSMDRCLKEMLRCSKKISESLLQKRG